MSHQVNCTFGKSCHIVGQCTLEDCVIGNNVTIEDSKLYNCKIGDNVVIKHNCVIYDTVVDNNSNIVSSYIEESKVGEHCKIGPYAHLRPKTTLLGYNKVGAYVETKNATLGVHTTASHLAYIGDATIGKYCNIGCGVVFINYDGVNKYHTTVGDYCFIGSQVGLVAPLSIGEKSFVAAGTIVTKDLAPETFSIGRVQPVSKQNLKIVEKDKLSK